MSSDKINSVDFNSTESTSECVNNAKVSILESPYIQYINNLKDELGCVITIKVIDNGSVMLKRDDVYNSDVIYNVDYIYKNYKDLDDYSKEHIVELLDFNYMGIIFKIFVTLGVLKECWMKDKENIEKFINLVDKNIDKDNNLLSEVKYEFNFDRAMRLFTFRYDNVYNELVNNKGSKARIKFPRNKNAWMPPGLTTRVNENGVFRIKFVVKSFLDGQNVWYDLLFFNIHNNIVEFINDDGNKMSYVLPYHITCGKLSRKDARYMLVHYLFYILCINNYGRYCSSAFYKLCGEQNLGMCINTFGYIFDFNKLIDSENFYEDIAW